MKIAFILGGGEPGRDGVGDYTALLAAECERAGHATFRLALHDRFVSGAVQGSDELRLPAAMPWRQRIKLAREAAGQFAPDAVSLQFVPYAFHPRGIPLGLARRMRGLAGGRPTHVMFHEIWIGAEIGASLRDRLTGALQKGVIRSLLRELRPASVHTSNPAYAFLLKQAGIEAGILPLFGSIPIEPAESLPATPNQLRVGMFGELHPVWPPEPLLGRLQKSGKSVVIEHTGRIGQGGRLWDAMIRQCPAIAFRRHGERPPKEISRWLQQLDAGLATTPLALIGKSGTVAAMLEHGLPVIVNRDDVHFRGLPRGGKMPGLIPLDEQFEVALEQAHRAARRSRLPETARQFLLSLPP